MAIVCHGKFSIDLIYLWNLWNLYIFLNYNSHSNGSNEDHNEEGEDQPDDAGSLSRSGSEDNVAQMQNGHNNNIGYTHSLAL